MNEVKQISPLLDGFSMGNPISEHHGVRCCPAIKENTDKKYIVKVISVPASQTQLDALLLAGAYKDPADALEYFRLAGERILKEAELLKKLSRLDGFLPYEGWQMEPITRRRLGYEVYLVGSYKRSLEKYLKKHAVTHLEAINLGLDLCSALALCRDAGSLYVALKPANIFVSDKKEYRIGDIGFIETDTLSYSALPEKYLSPYSPPELADPMVSVNQTVDTYAVGMILYQLYNDGQLPFKGLAPADKELPSPVNADYELAEIIMKAIHPDPAMRWADPKELGKALAAYMQRNSVNDVPVTPRTPLVVNPEDIVKIPKKQEEPVVQSEPEEAVEEAIPEETTADETVQQMTEPEELSVPQEAETPEEEPADQEAFEEPQEEETLSPEAAEPEEPIPSEEEIIPEAPAEETADFPDEDEEPEVPEETDEPEATDEPAAEPEPAAPAAVDELSRMLAQAEDLIAHQTPSDIGIPEAEDPFAFAHEDVEELDHSDIDELIAEEAEEPIPSRKKKDKKKKTKRYSDPKAKRKTKRVVSGICSLLALAALGVGAFWYYQNIYLIHVDDLILDVTQDKVTVTIESEKDGSNWIVRCVDPYGKTDTRGASGGSTSFADLQPNTMYMIQLDSQGFHRLTGETTTVFTTQALTNIVSFTSVVGAEDGSAILSFTVDGKEPRDWCVYYSAEGEEELRRTFNGHSVSISGLTVGKVYTFRLETGENISLSGETTLEMMASRLILADNIEIISENVTDISVTWNVPGDVVVEKWSVRCYDGVNYDETVTVTERKADFSGIDPSASYSIEVTASGMTQSSGSAITANPVSIQNLQVDDSSYNKLKISWDFTGTAPKDGWHFVYSIAGGEKTVIKCTKPAAEIPLRVPGAKYEMLIQTEDGTTVFNSAHTHQLAAAEPFQKHNLTADMLTVKLLKTPAEANWHCEDAADTDFGNTFVSGDSISLGLFSSDNFYLPGSSTNVLYVIEDAYGNIVPEYSKEESFYWKNIWNKGDVKNGELTLPVTPTVPGEYVLKLYFDGMLVTQQTFSIT